MDFVEHQDSDLQVSLDMLQIPLDDIFGPLEGTDYFTSPNASPFLTTNDSHFLMSDLPSPPPATLTTFTTTTTTATSKRRNPIKPAKRTKRTASSISTSSHSSASPPSSTSLSPPGGCADSSSSSSSRRQRNRVAAAKCRGKKKSAQTHLQDTFNHLQRNNTVLKAQTNLLRMELQTLRNMALSHGMCDGECQHIHSYNEVKARGMVERMAGMGAAAAGLDMLQEEEEGFDDEDGFGFGGDE